METKRERLIDLIWEYASDEFETCEDVLKLAKKEEAGLVEEVQSIANYYQENEMEDISIIIKERLTKINYEN